MSDPWRARVASALRANRPLAPEDAAVLLRDLEDGDVGETADARRYRRDEAIRALGSYHHGTARQIALAIEVKLRRYAAIGYARERSSLNHIEGERGMLFEVLELSDGKPLKFDKIYKVLRNK